MAALQIGDFEDLSGLLGSGVYALYFYGEVVYVGKAKCVLTRVYSHRNLYQRVRQRQKLPQSGPFTGIKPIRFTGVGVIPCHESDLDRIERAMIAKYRPKHNLKLVPQGKVSLAAVGFDFTPLLQTKEPEFVRRI